MKIKNIKGKKVLIKDISGEITEEYWELDDNIVERFADEDGVVYAISVFEEGVLKHYFLKKNTWQNLEEIETVVSNRNLPEVVKQGLVQAIMDREKRSITILGVKLDPANYPKLYNLAEEKPTMLEWELKLVAKSWGVRSMKSVMQTIESSEPLEFLGEKLDPLYYPILYRWAKEHPDTLKRTLLSLAKAWGGSLRSAKQALESDLEHG